jgi:hypothetical protein
MIFFILFFLLFQARRNTSQTPKSNLFDALSAQFGEHPPFFLVPGFARGMGLAGPDVNRCDPRMPMLHGEGFFLLFFVFGFMKLFFEKLERRWRLFVFIAEAHGDLTAVVPGLHVEEDRLSLGLQIEDLRVGLLTRFDRSLRADDVQNEIRAVKKETLMIVRLDEAELASIVLVKSDSTFHNVFAALS